MGDRRATSLKVSQTHQISHPLPAGHLRCRALSGVPRRQCRLLGQTAVADPHGAAEQFQREWDPQLQLLANDCRTHTAQLCSLLLVGGSSGG